MRTCCLLGMLVIVFYMTIKWGFEGKQPHWTQGTGDFVSVADKVFMFVLMIAIFVWSFSSFAVRHARLIVGVGLVLAGFATALDDFANENTAIAVGWLVVIFVAGIGTMPFRSIHALLLAIAMYLIYPIVIEYGPDFLDHPELHMERSQRLLMAITGIIGTVISGNLYHNRYLAFSRREKLKEAGARIADQAHRLEELDRIKARFFANLSHEFRTPLTLMMGPVEDALQGHSGPITTRLQLQLMIAKRNGRRLKELINQLLDLSRLEAGRM
ncbi:MAG: hypothetical protein HKN13_11100, partial [Rhodothermales bacterium]|nr:hypothetical protein [Rhodothermales bacterium]